MLVVYPLFGGTQQEGTDMCILFLDTHVSMVFAVNMHVFGQEMSVVITILQVTLLVGDVSFLHDTNGLALLKERCGLFLQLNLQVRLIGYPSRPETSNNLYLACLIV